MAHPHRVGTGEVPDQQPQLVLGELVTRSSSSGTLGVVTGPPRGSRRLPRIIRSQWVGTSPSSRRCVSSPSAWCSSCSSAASYSSPSRRSAMTTRRCSGNQVASADSSGARTTVMHRSAANGAGSPPEDSSAHHPDHGSMGSRPTLLEWSRTRPAVESSRRVRLYWIIHRGRLCKRTANGRCVTATHRAPCPAVRERHTCSSER